MISLFFVIDFCCFIDIMMRLHLVTIQWVWWAAIGLLTAECYGWNHWKAFQIGRGELSVIALFFALFFLGVVGLMLFLTMQAANLKQKINRMYSGEHVSLGSLSSSSSIWNMWINNFPKYFWSLYFASLSRTKLLSFS